MRVPNIGEMWRPTGARAAVLYVCVDILNTTVFKFERLHDGLRIKCDISDITKRWEFVQ